MPAIEKSIHIDAPPEDVFAYVADPENRPEFWPSLVEVRDVVPLESGGHKLIWVYNMAGIRAEGTGETIEHVPNDHTTDYNKGGLSSTFTYSVAPEDGGTRFTFQIDYDVHLPVFKKLASAFIVRVNEHEADAIMASVKAKLETMA